MIRSGSTDPLLLLRQYCIGRCFVGCAEAKMYGAVGRLRFARLPASQGDAVPLGESYFRFAGGDIFV